MNSSSPANQAGGNDNVELPRPTQRQREAVDLLRPLDDNKVAAWLSLLQSLKSGYEHHSCPVDLERKQLAALSLLKDCGPNHVLGWLRHSRAGKHPSVVR